VVADDICENHSVIDEAQGSSPTEWHLLYRSERQRLDAGLQAALSAFCAAGCLCVGIFLVVGAIRRYENLPIVVVPLFAPLMIWVAIHFAKSARVALRAARAEPGWVGVGVNALTFVCPEMFSDPLVVPRANIAKITLPPAERRAEAELYEESRGMKWIKLSLLAESPNCGVFLEQPMSVPSARGNELMHPTGWGRWPGTAPPVKHEPFQVIWLRTDDWTGARALRSWADGVPSPLVD
jgi:hypothetical protein